MVGPPYDLLANPLGAVRSTFQRALASSSGSDPTIFGGKDWGVADLFSEFLFDDALLSQVPMLNSVPLQRLQPNTLVRFRGMIQDMLGNEFYVGAYKDGPTWRTNKFTDVAQYPTDSPSEMRIWERRLLYCIPVPGLNSWTASCSDGAVSTNTNFTSPQREKRQRMDDTADDDMDVQDSPLDLEEFPCAKKMREEDGPPAQASHGSTSDGGWPSIGTASEFDCSCTSCLTKIYDSPESDLKLNDVFEFVGVLTFETQLTVEKGDTDELNNICEDALVHLPSSKVPRLHCLAYKKLAVHDFLSGCLALESHSQLVKGIRESLLGHLTAVLGNDGLAAHFILLHLLSRVHARVDTLAVGKLSLNLTCFKKESVSFFSTSLSLAVKNLLPFTRSIPLTVDYLNSASLAPRKDYETNRLVSGVLQLAEGSHLTIDGTQLQSGNLNSTGVENARLLRNLIDSQKVEYDFKYYKMEMTADVQLLILSEGKLNILPADLIVPFHPSSVVSPEIVDVETLKAWRWYLSTLRSLPHSIDPEMQKVLENDLVAARQADRSIGTEEFSRWLTMGRLMSISFGETSLSLEHWQMVKELERLRRERLC